MQRAHSRGLLRLRLLHLSSPNDKRQRPLHTAPDQNLNQSRGKTVELFYAFSFAQHLRSAISLSRACLSTVAFFCFSIHAFTSSSSSCNRGV